MEVETNNMATNAVRSFFADSACERGAVRVCRGLSCELNGAGTIRESLSLSAKAPIADVYCLGYCHSSPAVMDGDGEIYAGEEASRYRLDVAKLCKTAESGVNVRCVAREAVVTGRLRSEYPDKFADAIHAGVYRAAEIALKDSPTAIVDTVVASREQGRGGAGFPTGIKLRACAEQDARIKYVIANGDEGDPGSFVDRLLLESDPHSVIEGLLLCGYATGARCGIVYVRSEYPKAFDRMRSAIEAARAAGILGSNIFGSSFEFDVDVVLGRGSYVCGEETALLNAIEGKRGEVRIRPPYPVEKGLHNCPTVVNNIETLVNIPWIVRNGAAAYREMGTESSPGTKVFSLNAGFAKPGLIEAEFGITIEELIDLGEGSSDKGGDIAAVALGGPMGSVLLPKEWNVPIDYQTLREHGIRLGHGGLVAIPAGTDFASMLEEWLRFMASESCGKCVPCSAGSAKGLKLAQAIMSRGSEGDNIAELRALLGYIRQASLCGFGQETPQPLMTLLSLCEQDLPRANAQ